MTEAIITVYASGVVLNFALLLLTQYKLKTVYTIPQQLVFILPSWIMFVYVLYMTAVKGWNDE